MVLGTYVVDGLFINVLGWDGLKNNLFLDLLSQLLGGDISAVLGRDDNCVNTERNDGAVVMLVFNGDLGLGVWAEPRKSTVSSGSRHGGIQLVRHEEGEGEKFGGLVSGIAKHDTLITSTEVLESLLVVETLGNIWGLLLNGNEEVKCLVVETLGRVIVADVLDGISDNLLVVQLGLGGDLTKYHDHTGLGSSLASNLGEGILSQAGIKNSIGHLVGDLVRVTLAYRLGLLCKLVCQIQRLSLHGTVPHGEEEGTLIVGLSDGVNAVDSIGCHCCI
jgi:hypothetical protein